MSGFKNREGSRLLIFYALMLAAAVVLYLLIRAYGESLVAPAVAASASVSAPPVGAQAGTLFHVLLALVVVIVLARAIGTLFTVFHQPPVVGEILAGIILGPSVLGRLAPPASAYLLPPSVAPYLGVISEVGVVLYMFLVGLELDPGLLRRRGHATVAISHASIVVPFLMGAVLALYLYPLLSSSSVSFTPFSLFVGVSMSVTAFPVLARILTDRRMHRSRMGAITLTCAAVDDVTAWCLLAFVVSVVHARTSGALFTVAMALLFIAAIIFVVRPLMVRLVLVYGSRGRLTQGVMAAVFVALLLSALATDVIGIHAVFGAFALGAVMPHDSGLARELTDRLEDLLVVLLLPAFFAFTGLRTQIGLVTGAEQWLICGLITLVASLGKFGGSALAARITGLNWRDASALGILMNTRGLVELIVLNIGLDLKIISPALFAMLVLMALVTTFATTPMLQLITGGKVSDETREEKRAAQASEAVPAPLAAPPGPVLAAISNPRAVAPLVELALAASAEGGPPQVLTLVPRPAGGVRSGLREVEERIAPRAPVLLSAIDYARKLGATVEAQSMWTDNPARDIVETARRLQASWLLIGFHQPVFGANEMGGIVRRVLNSAQGSHLNVGIVTRGQLGTMERVFVLVDTTADGRAALDLGARVARAKSLSLHAVLLTQDGREPEPELKQIVRDAGRISGRWLYTDVLRDKTPAQLLSQTPGELVIVGARGANELKLPINVAEDDRRCVVVVQSGDRPPAPPKKPRAAWT